MQAEERIQTVGVRDVHGQRVRFTYAPSGVEIAGENGESVTFRKEDWQQVVEASVSQYGRLLNPSRSITGVIHCTDKEAYLTSVTVKDACDNCGAGFGVDGSAIHYPVSMGVCEITTGVARGGGTPDA